MRHSACRVNVDVVTLKLVCLAVHVDFGHIACMIDRLYIDMKKKIHTLHICPYIPRQPLLFDMESVQRTQSGMPSEYVRGTLSI